MDKKEGDKEGTDDEYLGEEDRVHNEEAGDTADALVLHGEDAIETRDQRVGIVSQMLLIQQYQIELKLSICESICEDILKCSIGNSKSR